MYFNYFIDTPFPTDYGNPGGVPLKDLRMNGIREGAKKYPEGEGVPCGVTSGRNYVPDVVVYLPKLPKSIKKKY